MSGTTPTFPAGPQQELVEALQELHRAAGLLSFRKVSTQIRKRDDRLSEASHESVRSALKGIRMPRWETVHDIVVVLAGLCSPPRDEESETARFLPLWRATREGESGALKSFQELLNGGWGGEDGKWTPELVMGTMLNPFSAIQIHPSLAAPHEPLISEDDWVRAVQMQIEEQGTEHVLRLLLHMLKGDYVGAEEGAPYGYRNADREAMEAYEAFRYGCAEILRRLRAEPNLLAESIRAMRADETMDRDDRAEMLENESDLSLMREVLIVTPDTWDDVSEEAHHMIFGYLIKQISPVGRIGLPDAERFRITWRIPEPPAA
ncbi:MULTISPECIES: hypothetical protein [Streptomyces]|uniref:hypothetical protein n=1 Tax=Streptomyces TaxID=1883 RepID=UPI000978D5CA|nr:MULTISPECIES: hypothetical protein [unclassified Streptomyces]ONI53609.1 hypothetical protein STIB_13100 [Streptomyces sp. IB2014 011-1]RDV51882.1 hypothetical protein DDV98_06530 [Streptomyces sp. IB2014 011-12]